MAAVEGGGDTGRELLAGPPPARRGEGSRGVPVVPAPAPGDDPVDEVTTDGVTTDGVTTDEVTTDATVDLTDVVVEDGDGHPVAGHADFVRFADLPEGSAERSALREDLLRRHLQLSDHLARRFAGRGEPHDDLVQVATIGLIKALDRFDPARGVPFPAYAIPTMLGEVKRHFRDRGWALRVPRRLQETGRALADAREALTHELGRAPTIAELAARTGRDTDEVVEILESANAYSTVPLDASPDSGASTLGSVDEQLERVDNREALRPLLAQLPPRERRILALRFVRGMSQSQIASEVGISQMHVSRLLSRTLAQLREGLGGDED
ncbi:RNA polymerase sigma factor SigF [Kineococcus sp. NUM-3379]